MDSSSLLRFLFLGTIWGGSYTFIKIALEGLAPGQLVLARIVLGLVALLVVIWLRRVGLPRIGGVWAHMVVTATLGMVAPFLLLAWGEIYTSAAMTGMLIASLPLITLGLAAALLPSERATTRKVIGLVVGFVGVVLVLAPWRSDPGSLKGQLAVLGAAACYAGQTVYVRRFLSSRGVTPLALATSQFVVAVLLQALVMPFLSWREPSVTWRVGISIVLLGVIGTGLGYVLYFRLIADLGATTASAVNYLVPVSALVISVSILHEEVTWNMILGALTVLLGLAFAENRLSVPRFIRASDSRPRRP